MTAETQNIERLQAEIAELRRRLEEAEEAMGRDEVEACFVEKPGSPQRTADRPFCMMIESMPQGALLLNTDGTILYCNSYFADLVKEPPEQVAGNPLQNYIGAEDRPAFAALLELGRTAAARGEISLPFGASTRRTLFTISPLQLGMVPALSVLINTATQETHSEELRRAEQAFHDSEERLRLALAAARMNAFDADLRRGRVRRTESAPGVLGLGPDCVDGTIQQFIDLLHPDDRPLLLAQLQRLSPAEPAYQLEYRILLPDKSIRWLHERSQASFDAEGKVERVLGVVVDITERKQMEEALRASQRFAQRIADINPAVLYIFDLREKRNIYHNREVLATLGYTPEQIRQTPTLQVRDLMHPDDLFRFAFHAEQLLSLPDGESLLFEYRMQHTDGTWRWFHSRDSVFERDAKGKPIQIIGAALDITERKLAEEKLRRQARDLVRTSALLETILTSAPVGFALLDQEMRYCLINQHLAEMNGLPPADHLGRALAEVFPGDASTAEAIFRGVMESGIPVIDNEVSGETPGAPGQKRTWLESWYPVRSPMGEFLGVGIVVHEITERKRLEHVLQESEERFRLLAETLPSIVWTAAPDGTITYANQRWFHYAGITPEQNARHWPELVLHPDDRERCVQAWTRALKEGTEYEIEVRNRSHDGTYRWFLTRAVPVRDARGGITTWIGTTTDIHDQKIAAESLRETDRRKNEFLAMLAHELRNPLGPIRNSVQILRLVGQEEPNLVEARDMIDRQVSHMARLIDDLLDVSRITRGKILLREERLNLVELVATACEDLRSVLEAGGLKLTVDLPDQPLWMDGDPTRLTQIIGNVLHNSCKFTDTGGQVSVRLREEPQTGRAALTLCDTGIGMEPEMLSHVFDAFSQADSSLERSHGGLGLGLALVKGIVELHGGNVVADSEGPGRGTEIIIRLPLAPGAPARPTPAPARTVVPRLYRMLVIEDNHDAAGSMKKLLEIAGHQVQVAHTGAEGLATARAGCPDVVLCDIGLPGGMDGYAVAQALRQDPAQQAAYLIALTGYGQEEDQRRSYEAGFDLHMTKPIDFQDLQRALSSLPARTL